jgi:hypothetical protein
MLEEETFYQKEKEVKYKRWKKRKTTTYLITKANHYHEL